MRRLMRNWCLLAAVIFTPSSVSNGTAALVIPLNSSSWCSDCGRIKLQMEKASWCCSPGPAISSPLRSLLLSYPLLAQHCSFSGVSSSRDSFISNGFMLSHSEAPSLFTKPSIKMSRGRHRGWESARQIYLIICTDQHSCYLTLCVVPFLIFLRSRLRLLKKHLMLTCIFITWLLIFSNLVSVWNQMLTSPVYSSLILNKPQSHHAKEVWGDAVKFHHL